MNLMYQIDVETLNDAAYELNAAFIVTAVYLGFVVIPVILICFCVVLKSDRNNCCSLCLMPGTLCLECVMSCAAIVYASAAMASYKNKSTSLTALDDAV